MLTTASDYQWHWLYWRTTASYIQHCFVVDSDEAADALDNELVDAKTLSFALRSLDTLLKLIYDGGLENVKIEMEKAVGKAL